MTFDIDESDRQLILLAIAKISIERPGWLWICGQIAEKFRGREMFEKFRTIHGSNADGK